MPGVPSGRACDGCRKTKKKCDEKQPACSRCIRLKIPCVGSGQKRYKFMEENRFPKSPNSDDGVVERRTLAMNQVQFFAASPSPTPSNGLTQLSTAFIHTIKRTTDLRYNLWWAFGMFLEDVPPRLGSNEALDHSVDALTSAHASFSINRVPSVDALAKYSRALKSLRSCLDDPATAQSSSTLGAVMVLLSCQGFIGGRARGSFTGHAEGATRILKARKQFIPRDEFERKVFLSLRGTVFLSLLMVLFKLFEGLFNHKISLSPHEWDNLVASELDRGTPDGQILHYLSRAPGIMRRGKEELRLGHDITEIRNETRSIYEACKTILAELKARDAAGTLPGVGPTSSAIATILHAHVQRTYGIGLAIVVFFNCMLGALDPNDKLLAPEMTYFAREVVSLAYRSAIYRPIGAAYIIVVLHVALAATTDPQMRELLQHTMGEYQKDKLFGTETLGMRDELENTARHMRFGMAPPPDSIVETIDI
ncbi:transcriptional regulator family: Fungal Specific TF [Penicillium lagena]|uniref:transcriptional regulator family: Fungal Specific TF n=1 Tax=Penicillium lagena TaxID=94218 RepID=UPI002540B5E3|nr:transcriptional regulator family: Fungal Specific TF [Penicillium lagena]KAJ5610247.1 transcriptional regulator family: Fungal Specific TF [Penicillium lagena]